MTRYTGNTYDAVWLSALTMIEIGDYNNVSFIESFPDVARSYEGVSGNCSLDQYGDRLYGNYHIYNYVKRGWDVYLSEIGYYDSENSCISWSKNMRDKQRLIKGILYLHYNLLCCEKFNMLVTSTFSTDLPIHG